MLIDNRLRGLQGSNRVRRSQRYYFGPVKKKRVGCLVINRKRRNLFLTLSDIKGRVIYAASSGYFGFKRRKRVSPLAAEVITKKLGVYARACHLRHIEVLSRIKSRVLIFSAVRALISRGFTISGVAIRIAVAHNGCRKKKARRL